LLRIQVFRDVTLGSENRGTRSLQNFGNHSNNDPALVYVSLICDNSVTTQNL
jgi:hypothetical protein